jgi:hypothetical protein
MRVVVQVSNFNQVVLTATFANPPARYSFDTFMGKNASGPNTSTLSLIEGDGTCHIPIAKY